MAMYTHHTPSDDIIPILIPNDLPENMQLERQAHQNIKNGKMDLTWQNFFSGRNQEHHGIALILL